jgi:hypothetical protein
MPRKAKKVTQRSTAKNQTIIDSFNRSTKGIKLLLFMSFFGILGLSLLITSYAAQPVGKGKPGGGGKPRANGSITVVMVTDTNADGLPNYGERLKFDVITTATTEPHVSLLCYQNGTLVYSAQTGYFEGYPWPGSQTMTLSSNSWTGGAADCTANGYYFDGLKTVDFAGLQFQVGQ